MDKEKRFKLWPLMVCLLMGLFLSACSSKNTSKKTTQKAVPRAATFSGTVYTVKPGDTLSKISRMTGHSVGDLARLNNIAPPYKLLVGQRVKVNVSQGSKTASRSGNAGSNARTRSSSPAVQAPPVGGRCWLWPVKGQVIEPYSDKEGGNKGIDIAGKRGEAIYASGPGTVVYVGNQLRGYGNLVMIKHSDDYITAYAHTDTMLVNTGQKIKAGQKIATMGNSGASSVRLHFQLRYRATAIDPQRYLKDSC